MKKQLLSVCVMFFILGITATAHATFSGEYMFTVSGNDTTVNISAVEVQAETWFSDVHSIDRDVTFSFYDKVNEPDTTSVQMTVTYNSGNQDGTWTTDLPVEFYTVKASKEFALYWLGDSGASSGIWSTEHLLNGGGQQPAISHLSTWNTVASTDPNQPVPEPTTVVLFGLGLAGLVGMGIKKRRKKQV